MKIRFFLRFVAGMLLLSGLPLLSNAAESLNSGLAPAITDDQHYNRAIHIMAMLLVGFGFLMVFVRKYGRSALTATFLLVSISLPLYMFISSKGTGINENDIHAKPFDLYQCIEDLVKLERPTTTVKHLGLSLIHI